MTKIHEILTELRAAPGCKGAALVTADGLIVAQSLDPRFRDDVVAGLASFLVMTTEKCLAEGGMGSFTMLAVYATAGRTLFARVDDTYLVAILDQFVESAVANRTVAEAAQQLKRCARLTA